MLDMLWCYAGRTLRLAGCATEKLSVEKLRSSFQRPADVTF
jgi:hypothetical protein